MSEDQIAKIKELPPYIYVQDVVDNFAMTRSQIWKLLKRRKIRGSKSGSKRWKIKTESIFKYLAAEEKKLFPIGLNAESDQGLSVQGPA